ncbi:MAG: hypothetical protein R3E89_12870 [Thiolinea sp.]
MLKISLSDAVIAMPPYTPVLDLSAGWEGLKNLWQGMDFENFTWLLEDDIYWLSYLSSLKIALISTLLTLLVGYPMAYGMARPGALPADAGDADYPAVLDQFRSGCMPGSASSRTKGC